MLKVIATVTVTVVFSLVSGAGRAAPAEPPRLLQSPNVEPDADRVRLRRRPVDRGPRRAARRGG